MDAAQMNANLALLTPDEIEDALRFVEICERGGGTPPDEADEWRRRNLGHRTRRATRQVPTVVGFVCVMAVQFRWSASP